MIKLRDNFFIREDEVSSDSEVEEEAGFKLKKKKRHVELDSDDEDNRKRVVRSKKDKVNEKYYNLAEDIDIKLNIQDFQTVYTKFESMQKELKKSQKRSMSRNAVGTPPIYYKVILKIDEIIQNTTNKDRKKLSKTSNKGFNKLKQLFKKLLLEVKLKKELEEYKKNPLVSEDEESEEEDEEIEEEEEEQSSDSDSDDDSSDSDDSKSDDDWDDEESEEIEEELDYEKNRENMTREQRRLYWLKKDDPSKKKKTKDEKEREKANQRKKHHQNPAAEKKFNIVNIEKDYSLIPIEGKALHNRLNKMANGRAQLDAKGLESEIDILKYILSKTNEDRKKIEILIMILNFYSEITIMRDLFMKRNIWFENFQYAESLLELLQNFGELEGTVYSYLRGDDPLSVYNKQDIESVFLSSCTTLHKNWDLAIRFIEVRSAEYPERLKNEIRLISLLKKAEVFYTAQESPKKAATVSFRILCHIYHLSDSKFQRLKSVSDNYPYENPNSELIDSLARKVYVHLKNTPKARLAALYQAFNAGANNKFQKGRDILLQNNLSDGNSQDVRTSEKVTFNRALVQLGLCAFRLGKFEECKTVLDDICTSFKLSELLQQSIPKNAVDRDDKRQLIPYHLHISIEKIQSVYLICIMILEVPKLLSHEISNNKMRNIQYNKIFLKLWSVYEKNSVYGSPENYKDMAYLAIRELSVGNWEKSLEHIKQLDFWERLENSEAILEKVSQTIKQQGFKCFILSMKRSHHKLNFKRLCQLFTIEENELRRIIFQMIHNKEIEARIDVQSGSLFFGTQEVNDISKLSNDLNRRLQGNVSLNEKLFNFKYGGGDYHELINYSEGIQQKKVSSSKKPVLLGR